MPVTFHNISEHLIQSGFICSALNSYMGFLFYKMWRYVSIFWLFITHDLNHRQEVDEEFRLSETLTIICIRVRSTFLVCFSVSFFNWNLFASVKNLVPLHTIVCEYMCFLRCVCGCVCSAYMGFYCFCSDTMCCWLCLFCNCVCDCVCSATVCFDCVCSATICFWLCLFRYYTCVIVFVPLLCAYDCMCSRTMCL